MANATPCFDRGAPQTYWAQLYDERLGAELTDEMFESNAGIGDTLPIPAWEATRCLEAGFTLSAFRNNGTIPHDPYTLWSSYCFNGVTPGFDTVPESVTRMFFGRVKGARAPRRLGTIEFPSQILLFQDGSEVVIDGNGDTLVQMFQWDTEGTEDDHRLWRAEYFRHPGGCGDMWTDGRFGAISEAEANTKKLECSTAPAPPGSCPCLGTRSRTSLTTAEPCAHPGGRASVSLAPRGDHRGIAG